MKKLNLFLSILVAGLLFASCSSDDDNGSSASADQIAVFMVSTSSGGFDIQYDNTTFCYEGEDCETISGFSFVGVFGTDRLDMEYSARDKKAEGVLIENIQITDGSGYFEVVSGTRSGSDFQEANVLFTSDEFFAHDNATISWGRTE